MKLFTNRSRHDFENGFIRHTPHLMIGMVVLFVAAAVVFGEMLDVYDRFWWWDDMLHGVSGILFSLIGLGVLYAVSRTREISLAPVAIALFTMCFAITMGVAWEIYEFTMDVASHATMQQWNMGPSAIVMGRDYQGMGLRDTMSDLILATVGAVLTSFAIYGVYRWNEPFAQRVMRWTFPLKRVKN